MQASLHEAAFVAAPESRARLSGSSCTQRACSTRSDEAQAGANGVGSRGKVQEVQSNCATRAPHTQLVCTTHSAASALRDRVAAVLGNAPDVIEPGRMHRFSTSGRPGDDAGWCKLFDDMRGGIFGCWRSGISDSWHMNGHPPDGARFAREIATATIERLRLRDEQWSANGKRNAAMWAQCRPLTGGDPAALYLRRRRIAGAMPACLRFHPALPYYASGELIGVFPAMVAQLVARDRRLVALHRTYLTNDGRKANVPTVKKLTQTAGLLAGACIPLGQPLGGRIAVAEGIETALAAQFGSRIPTVAAYSAGNLAGWLPPAGVREVVVFGDNDQAGREASATLQTRMLALGIRCGIVTPSDDGADWCDVLQQRGAFAEFAS